MFGYLMLSGVLCYLCGWGNISFHLPQIRLLMVCRFVQNGNSDGELMIKNAQLKHAGRYTCTAQTPVDDVTASAQLVVRGKS